MKVGIDIRPLESSTKNRGIGYYTGNVLLEMLQQKDNDLNFILYKTLTGKLSVDFKLKNGDKFYGLPTLFHPRRGIRRFDPILAPFWSRALKKTKSDLVHLTSFFEVYCLPMPKNVKTVVTLHDLIPILFAKECFDNDLAKQWYLNRLEAIKQCEKIITISKSAKEDIVKILGVPENKVVVIYGGLDKRFKVLEKEKVKKILLEKYKINDQYLLSVGAPSYHKNMSRIFQSLKKYLEKSQNNSIKLVVVCKLQPFEKEKWQKEISELSLGGKIILTDFVPDEDMSVFYSGAEALLFPSLYEGFGLPILEAMACGTPVLTSNVSSMPEVAGKAALLVDPYSVEDITQGIFELTTNHELRTRLTKLGFEQIKKFSWEKAARETLGVYRSLK